MIALTLDQLRKVIDQLPPYDQIKLMEHLTQRIGLYLLGEQAEDPTVETSTLTNLWKQFDDPATTRLGARTASEELSTTRR